jgi:cytokinin dehydrogenase
MGWQAEYAAKLNGRVFSDDVSLQELSNDFGRVVKKRPAAVVRPESAQDVAAAMKLAIPHSLPATARGAGHSQSGQSLSDQLVLDMRRLNQVLRIDPERRVVVCQPGITWRALLSSLLPLQLSPPILTNNLDATVGGTLSTAGIGVASWRHGTQADHCLELEVVTGEGEIVRCSPGRDRELFDAVRAGLGQFGVMTEVTLELRRHKPYFRSFYLLYDGLPALLDDLKAAMDEERFDHLEAWCVPLPQGFKSEAGHLEPVAQWFFPFHATIETDAPRTEPTREDLLGRLRFYRHVHTEEGHFERFLSRLDPLFALWKSAGFWDQAHPWMECILPWDVAPIYVPHILRSIPPQMLQGGHILLWPSRGSASTVPLLVRPDTAHLMGFGILLAVPEQALKRVLPLLDRASEAAIQAGGKRYLSGWLNFDSVAWKSHYGSLWPEVVRLKGRYDPHGILNAKLMCVR